MCKSIPQHLVNAIHSVLLKLDGSFPGLCCAKQTMTHLCLSVCVCQQGHRGCTQLPRHTFISATGIKGSPPSNETKLLQQLPISLDFSTTTGVFNQFSQHEWCTQSKKAMLLMSQYLKWGPQQKLFSFYLENKAPTCRYCCAVVVKSSKWGFCYHTC